MRLLKSVATVLTLGFVILVGACSHSAAPVLLQREWTANAEFAGDVLAIQAAKRYGLNLDVREGSEIIDPIKMVRSGSAQFGVASSDRVLRENEGGAGLVIIASVCYRSPVVFLANPSRGIKTPADFAGHTVGIQAGTNTDLIYHSLVKQQNVTNVNVVESGWGTTNFETGTLDVLAAFDYDEPVQLDMKKVSYIVIRPEDYGVRFVGTVYFTSRALVDKDPELVQTFVRSLVNGWRQALQDPAAAIDAIGARFPTMQSAKNKELRSLERGKVYFAGEGGRLLYTSQERWNLMGAQLMALGAVHEFSFRDNVEYRFLDEALRDK